VPPSALMAASAMPAAAFSARVHPTEAIRPATGPSVLDLELGDV
jgi:hypothetical protein